MFEGGSVDAQAVKVADCKPGYAAVWLVNTDDDVLGVRFEANAVVY